MGYSTVGGGAAKGRRSHAAADGMTTMPTSGSCVTRLAKKERYRHSPIYKAI
jgi:hypothetical protein